MANPSGAQNFDRGNPTAGPVMLPVWHNRRGRASCESEAASLVSAPLAALYEGTIQENAAMALTLVNTDALHKAARSSEPYDYFLGQNFLNDNALDDLRRDFPAIEKPGYLTVDEVQLKGKFKTLIDELGRLPGIH